MRQEHDWGVGVGVYGRREGDRWVSFGVAFSFGFRRGRGGSGGYSVRVRGGGRGPGGVGEEGIPVVALVGEDFVVGGCVAADEVVVDDGVGSGEFGVVIFGGRLETCFPSY